MTLPRFSRTALRSLVLGTAAFLTVVPGSLAAQESGDLFVSSRNTHSVKRFDSRTGAYLGDFVAPGSGGLNQTQEVAFGPDGHLYVSGRGNAHILRFDGETGAFLDAFTSGYDLDNPTKMTFGPDGYLYVSQWGEERGTVVRFDAETGAFDREVTQQPLELGMAHAWDADGVLYVASYGSRDVRRIAPDGSLIDVFVGPDILSSAVNLWFGEEGDLFVVDWEAGSVERFDGETGAHLGRFIGGLAKAEGVTIGPDGLIYLCDWEANRIERFDPETGARIDTFTSEGGMLAPNGLVFRTR